MRARLAMYFVLAGAVIGLVGGLFFAGVAAGWPAGAQPTVPSPITQEEPFIVPDIHVHPAAGAGPGILAPAVGTIIGAVVALAGTVMVQLLTRRTEGRRRRGDRQVKRLNDLCEAINKLDEAYRNDIGAASPQPNVILTTTGNFDRAVALISNRFVRDRAVEWQHKLEQYVLTAGEPDEQGEDTVTIQEVERAQNALMNAIRAAEAEFD